MKPLLVLGMLRSGTSATTRALGLLGASMGPEASMGMFWENQPMRRVNRNILDAFDGDWDSPPALPADWVRRPEVRAFIPQARATLLQEFGSAAVMVWKDPRTCITLPFWRDVFDEEPIVVFIHRHPVEVASSATTRNQLTRGHGFAVWERFNADALVNAVGLPTVVLEYEPLVEDPIGTMNSLVKQLAEWGVELPNDPANTDMELTPKRRHHQADVGDVFDDPIATESQRDLFALLRETNGASRSFALPRAVPEPHPLSAELLSMASQAYVARREARHARDELHQAVGSRRRLLRRLLDQTAPGRA
jgi:hypothetical protein